VRPSVSRYPQQARAG